MVITGNLTGAFCCMKRILPLVIANQKEYLDIIKTTKEMQLRFGENAEIKHLELADKYYSDNNYFMSLFEYENGILINPSLQALYDDKIQRIKSFLKPEERIIKTCFEKGNFYHSGGDYLTSNKYFTKIISLSDENSQDYKIAKSRIVNV